MGPRFDFSPLSSISGNISPDQFGVGDEGWKKCGRSRLLEDAQQHVQRDLVVRQFGLLFVKVGEEIQRIFRIIVNTVVGSLR